MRFRELWDRRAEAWPTLGRGWQTAARPDEFESQEGQRIQKKEVESMIIEKEMSIQMQLQCELASDPPRLLAALSSA